MLKRKFYFITLIFLIIVIFVILFYLHSPLFEINNFNNSFQLHYSIITFYNNVF